MFFDIYNENKVPSHLCIPNLPTTHHIKDINRIMHSCLKSTLRDQTDWRLPAGRNMRRYRDVTVQ